MLWWEQIHEPRRKTAYVRSGTFPLRFRALVGTSGLEPPTSRLSGVCSNQLSYVPVLNFARGMRYFGQ